MAHPPERRPWERRRALMSSWSAWPRAPSSGRPVAGDGPARPARRRHSVRRRRAVARRYSNRRRRPVERRYSSPQRRAGGRSHSVGRRRRPSGGPPAAARRRPRMDGPDPRESPPTWRPASAPPWAPRRAEWRSACEQSPQRAVERRAPVSPPAGSAFRAHRRGPSAERRRVPRAWARPRSSWTSMHLSTVSSIFPPRAPPPKWRLRSNHPRQPPGPVADDRHPMAGGSRGHRRSTPARSSPRFARAAPRPCRETWRRRTRIPPGPSTGR